MKTLDSLAHDFILKMVAYLEDSRTSPHYEYWMLEWNDDPAFRTTVARVARSLLAHDDCGIVRSAMQALSVAGETEDIELIASLCSNANAAVRSDVDACKRTIQKRMKTLEEMLDEVVDWKTFAAFVENLAAERERAQKIENANSGDPAYIVNGALGWNNGDIQGFLCASLSYFPDLMTDDDERAIPTWRNFAAMLYYGKTTE
ncbi:MAG: hypothetical protein IT423_20110 [Pirellulaceae bacterium]|nr:hypothetical protein [Pirellulaceae bacterium]